MRVVLHVGLPKTGSTTLQRFLAQNAAVLAAQGVAYPCDEPGANPTKQSWIGEAVRRAPERVTAMAQAHRGAETLVLSGEFFIYMRRKLVARLRDALVGGGADDFLVIIYVRNLADRLLSLCNQFAKSKTLLYADTLGGERARPPIGESLQNWEAVFGAENVDVRLLEHAQPLEEDFCAAAGIGWSSQFQSPLPFNVSVDPISAQVLALLRAQFDIPMTAYTLMQDGGRLARLENRYLVEIAEAVAATDLSHPKLARFEGELRSVRYRPDAGGPTAPAYLERLVDSLAHLQRCLASGQQETGRLPDSEAAAMRLPI